MQSCNVRYGMAFVQHNQLKQQYKFISKQRKLYIFEKYIMDEKSQNFECVVQRSVITNTARTKRFGSELHDTIYKESLYIYIYMVSYSSDFAPVITNYTEMHTFIKESKTLHVGMLMAQKILGWTWEFGGCSAIMQAAHTGV